MSNNEKRFSQNDISRVLEEVTIRYKHAPSEDWKLLMEILNSIKDKVLNNEDIDNDFPFDKDSEKRRLKQLEINQTFLLNAIMEIHSNLCPDKFGTWQMKVEQAVAASKEAYDEAHH
jgi:hypothetical protein